MAETRRLLQRNDGSYVRAMVYAAISTASLGDERKAVSANSIAQSYALSTETVRRQAHALSRQGRCRRAKGGFYTPFEVLVADLHRADVSETIRESMSLCEDLVSASETLEAAFRAEIDQAPLESATSVPADLRARWIFKFYTDRYFLRLWEFGVAAHGDSVLLMLFMVLIALNTGAIEQDRVASKRYAGRGQPPPDALVVPASATEIAQAIGVPHSTAARRLDQMVQMGRAVRVGGKFVFARAFMETPGILEAGLMTTIRTVELVRRLRSIQSELS